MANFGQVFLPPNEFSHLTKQKFGNFLWEDIGLSYNKKKMRTRTRRSLLESSPNYFSKLKILKHLLISKCWITFLIQHSQCSKLFSNIFRIFCSPVIERWKVQLLKDIWSKFLHEDISLLHFLLCFWNADNTIIKVMNPNL